MTKILQIDREAAKRLDQNAECAGIIKDPHLMFPAIDAEHLASHREQATAELYEALTEAARYIEGYRDMPVGIKERINSALTKATPDA